MTSTLPPRTTRRVDPVTLQVLVSRLSGIVQEMQESVFRTGYSTIIRESHDASCMLMDANGDIVGSHAVAPLHAGSLMATARAFKATFGADMAPGDAYITNHPYMSGVAHSVDMAVITPVFYDGALIAFSGGIAHKSDLGGVIPGTGYGQARELFQEGIMYPPVRLVRAGEWVRDVETVLRANSRTPDLIMGDIRGQLGVARLGERPTSTISRPSTCERRSRAGRTVRSNPKRSWTPTGSISTAASGTTCGWRRRATACTSTTAAATIK
jgi:N-methylhydantoinase B